MSTTKELILELKSEMSNRFDKIEARLANLEADVSILKADIKLSRIALQFKKN